jgi:hypothetical protein
MSKPRGKVTQQGANEIFENMRNSGYTREQLSQAFEQFFPAQEQEEGELLRAAADLSLEDVKVNTSEVASSSLRSATALGLSVSGLDYNSMAVASNKSGGGKIIGKSSAAADDKKEADNDFFIDPKDLVENSEEPI